MGKAQRIRKERETIHESNEMLSELFRQEIRNSEMWPQMVAMYGEEKAEALLKECRGEIKPE
jgi:hypothetical protein